MNKGFQEQILSAAVKEGMNVVIYLTSGFQIRGVIKGYDSYVIIIESEGKQQMVYKHAVSTIAPGRFIKLSFGMGFRENSAEDVNGE